MKNLYYLWFLISSVSFSQSNYYNEEELYKRANDYSRAFLGNNRYELPTSDERKLMKNKDQNVEDYASKKALECFEYLINNFPSSKNISDYYFKLGTLEYHLKSYEKSRKNLIKSIETNKLKTYPFIRKTHILLAKALIEEKSFNEALICLQEIGKHRLQPMCGNQFFDESNEVKPLYEIIQINLEQN